MLARRCLLVEDDPHLRESLARYLIGQVEQLECCADTADARAAIFDLRPELIVLDFQLPDGTAFEVLDAADRISPPPIVVVVSGKAGAEEAFKLHERGVRGYLSKPVTPKAFLEALRAALEQQPSLEPMFRVAVGRLGLNEVEELARRTMIEEAITREDGNRRGAARLLRVSRQMLQHALRALSDG